MYFQAPSALVSALDLTGSWLGSGCGDMRRRGDGWIVVLTGRPYSVGEFLCCVVNRLGGLLTPGLGEKGLRAPWLRCFRVLKVNDGCAETGKLPARRQSRV